MLNRSNSFPSLVVAALLLAGCESAVEEEHREVTEAQSELVEAERKAAAEKADIDRKAAEERSESDRPVADAKEKVAEERADAARAEELDRNARRALDERLEAFDKKLVTMRAALKTREGKAKLDTQKLIADMDRRRAVVKADLDQLKGKTGSALASARVAVEDALARMESEIDAALARGREAIKG